MGSSMIGGNLGSDSPLLSSNGSAIVFRSDASNLVADDNNGMSDVFAYGPPAIPPLTQSAAFVMSASMTLGLNPSSVAVTDLNGDGKPDLIVANKGTYGHPGSVSVLLGNGDGTFQAPMNYNLGGYPVSVAVADVNGDGRPDIIVANLIDVAVLLGNSDGTFSARRALTLYSTGFLQPNSVAVADVNGDGRPDLVVTYSGSMSKPGNVSVLLGNGDGTFQPPVSFAAGTDPRSVAVADVNGDGRPDLVVADYGVGGSGGGVSVLLGNGNGTFQPALNQMAGMYPDSVAIADVNGDGRPDLVVGNAWDFSNVRVLLGNGNGTFQPAQNLTMASRVTSVAIADVNGDGRPDLVVTTHGNRSPISWPVR